jgi:enoyl-CoA hydratase
VTNKLLEMSIFLDLKKSLQLDHVIAMNFLNASDFQEGIRAQVIDKDKKPRWKYDFHNINDDMIRCFFTPIFMDCELAVSESTQNLVN